jgi:hypothetical protein
MSSGRDTWLSPPRYVPPRGYRHLGARKPLEDSPADITVVVTNFARSAVATRKYVCTQSSGDFRLCLSIRGDGGA